MKLQILILFLLISFNLNAQIGATKEEIIEKQGANYVEDVSDYGVDFMLYESQYKSDESGIFTRSTVMYLKKKNGVQFCYEYLIMEPSSETNAWVNFYNKKNYVKLKELKWKDYKTNLIYEIRVGDGLCYIKTSSGE